MTTALSNRPGLFAMTLVVCALAGCQARQARDREAALHRWNEARARIKARLAAERFEAGNVQAAAEELAVACRLDPDNPDLVPLRIRVALAEGRTRQAEQLLQRARRDSPPRAETEYLLGIVRQQQERWEEALDAFRRAAELDPEQVAYVAAAAQVCLQLGRPQQALALLRDAAPRFEWTDTYQDVLAETCAQLGDWPAAARAWQRVADHPSAGVDVRERLAEALFHSGQFAEAIAVLTELLEDPPTSQTTALRLMLGECYLATGQPRTARTTAQQILQDQREHPPAMRLLARSLAAEGDYAAALRVAREALGQRSDDPRTLELAAGLAWRVGEKGSAARFARQLAEIEPDNPAAERILAACGGG